MDSNSQKLSFNVGRQTGPGQMKICPTCSLTLAEDMTVCPNDGTFLTGGAAPKLISNLAGQYEFIGKIGEGGMGVVYKARHLALNHLVAIKMMHVNKMDQNKILRFQQEAKAVSSLDHPSIVRVRDFGISEAGQPHMVLDYIDGVTLESMIKTHGPLSLTDAKELFTQICDAVAHAHQRKVLHRDLKPSNIMLVYRDNQPPLPVIVDFGIAKVVDPGQQQGMNLTQTGEIFGSPFYMSPEQTAGKELDQRSDVYSVGCVLFETLTGAPPFVGQNAIETLIMHTSASPPTLKQGSLGKVFPAGLQAVMDKALAKDPQNRFQDMNSFKVALLKAIDQPDVVDASTNLVDSRKKVNSSLPIIAATTVLILFAVSASAWYFVKRSKNNKAIPVAASAIMATTDNKKDGLPAKTEAAQNAAKTTDTATATNGVRAGLEDPELGIPDIEESAAKAILRNKDKDEIEVEFPTDKSMSAFDQVTKATSVKLMHATIEGPGLKHLEHLHLRTFILEEDPALQESGIQTIANQRDLHELSLEDDPISDESLWMLNYLPELEILNLSQTGISGSGLYRMRGCHHLKKLDLCKCMRLEDKDLGLLQNFTFLEELRLSKSSLKNIGLMARGGTITPLKLLELDGTPFDDDSIKGLKPLPALVYLTLDDTKVTPSGLMRLASFTPALKFLGLNDCKAIKNSDLSFVPAFKKLQRLDLNGWRSNESGIAVLVKSNLRSLKLTFTVLEDSDLLKLAQMKSLHDLKLRGNSRLTPEALSQFRRLRPDVELK